MGGSCEKDRCMSNTIRILIVSREARAPTYLVWIRLCKSTSRDGWIYGEEINGKCSMI